MGNRSQDGAESSGVEGLTAHDLRLIETLNADPNRTRENSICCAETGWKNVPLTTAFAKEIGADFANFISKKARNLIAKLGIVKIRENACKVVNLQLMVSPEWLRDGHLANPVNPEKARQFTAVCANFLRQKYEEIFLVLIGHLDELNAHMSGYILPAVLKTRGKPGRPPKGKSAETAGRKGEESWGLDAKSMFTPDLRVRMENSSEPLSSEQKSKAKTADAVTPSDDESQQAAHPKAFKYVRIIHSGTCSRIQTEFAEFCQKQGLDVVRGIAGSRAKHQDIAEFNHLLRCAAKKKEEIEKIADPDELRALVLANQLKAEEYERVSRELSQLKKDAQKMQQPLIEINRNMEGEIRGLRKERNEARRQLELYANPISASELIEKLTGVSPTTDPKNGHFLFRLPLGLALAVDPKRGSFRCLSGFDVLGKTPEECQRTGAIEAAVLLLGCQKSEGPLILAKYFPMPRAMATLAAHAEQALRTSELLRRTNFEKDMLDLGTTEDASAWVGVEEQRVRTFGLEREYLGSLHDARLIYANKLRQLVTRRYEFPPGKPCKIVGWTVQDLCAPMRQEFGAFGVCPIAEPAKPLNAILTDDIVTALAIKLHRKRNNEPTSILVLGKADHENMSVWLKGLADVRNVWAAPAEVSGKTSVASTLRQIDRYATILEPPDDCASWAGWLRIKAKGSSGGGAQRGAQGIPFVLKEPSGP